MRRTYCTTLNVESGDGSVRIVTDALEFLPEKVEAAQHAAVHLVERRLRGRVRVVCKQLAVAQQPLTRVPELDHGLFNLVECIHVCLRAFPQDLAVAFDQLPVHFIQIKVGVALGDVNLVAVCNGVLETPQPVPRFALLVVHGAVEVMAEQDGRQDQRVGNVGGTGTQVLVDNLLELAGVGALGVARRDGRPKIVAQHELPPPGKALFADVGFAKDDLQVRVGVVLVERGPEKGPDDAGPLDGAERQAELADHSDVVVVGVGDVICGKRLGVLCAEL
jgi:hypothetical protein